MPGGHALIGNFKVEGVTPSFDGEKQKVKIKVKLDDHGCFVVDSAVLMDKLPLPEGEAAAAAADTKAETKSEPMDTDAAEPAAPPAEDAAAAAATPSTADKEKAKDEQPKKKAKTHKNVDLSVVSTRPASLTSAALQKLVEEELEMQAQDKQEVEKSIARNALEEYIYDMRDKIGSLYEEFIKPEEKESFSSKLDTTLDWLTGEEDENKSVYVEKLNELKGTSKPVEARHTEAVQRPEAEQSLRAALAKARRFVDLATAGDEAYAHIDPKNVKKVADELQAREKWLDEKLQEQLKKAKYDPPVVLVSSIVQQREELEKIVQPIVNTPKPKVEPPKEEKKEEKKDDAAAPPPPPEPAAADPAPMEHE